MLHANPIEPSFPLTDSPKPTLTVMLPTMREADNLRMLIPRLKAELEPHVRTLEFLIVDTPTDDGTEAVAAEFGARYLSVPPGYGDAMRAGFAAIETDLVATMDADCSHDPAFIPFMLRHIPLYDVVICSRYAEHGGQETTLFRYFTSRVLNVWLGCVCTMPLLDLSGGFRLYRREVVDELPLEAKNFEVQAELAIKAFGHGFRLHEVGFVYHPRAEGRSKAAVIRYGLTFLFTSLRLRKWRNSRDFCDYDERAFNSRIPLQRIWQRRRYDRIVAMQRPTGRCLDIGCGSGRLILGFPHVIGLDINHCILRYLAHQPRRLVAADAPILPFRSDSFDTIFCCDVIEHLDDERCVFNEVARVLRPGGTVLFSTPDYGTPVWPVVESLYNTVIASARGHEHPTRYSRQRLQQAGEAAGLKMRQASRVNGAILLMQFENVESS